MSTEVVVKPKTAVISFHVNQGATFQHTFTWKDSNDDPVDLTGYSARMKIKTSFDAASDEISLTDGDGITLGGSNGTIDVEISDSDTAAFTWEEAVYDIELVDGNGKVTRLVKGRMILDKEVTT